MEKDGAAIVEATQLRWGLGQLCSLAWTCLQAEVRRLRGRDDVQLDVGATIETHGDSASSARFGGAHQRRLERTFAAELGVTAAGKRVNGRSVKWAVFRGCPGKRTGRCDRYAG